MKSFVSSFRGRLTLLCSGTMLVALLAYSAIVGQINVNRILDRIDHDLLNRATRIASRPGPPPGLAPRQGQREGAFPPPGRFGFPDVAERNGPPPRDPQDAVDQSLGQPEMMDAQGHFINAPAMQPYDSRAASQAIGSGVPVFTDVEVRGERLRVLYFPWQDDRGQIVGAVQLGRGLRDVDDFKSTQIETLLMLLPFGIALAAFAGMLVAKRALQPVSEMERAADLIGRGQLNQRLHVSGDDELARLAKSFNNMVQRLQLSFEDQELAYKALKESYESQKRFTADASHELRTPLARMQLATSSALRGPESGYRQALEVADDSSKSMAKLIRELLVLARADAGQLGLKHDSIDLRLVVSDALNKFTRPIDVHFPNNAVMVVGDQDHLERVITNLIENAVRHTDADKPMFVSLKVCEQDAVLSVEDAGSGISPEHLTHIFERFYRADSVRSAGDGIGLGLAICKSIVEAHRGSISVKSEPGKGTRFEVVLPLASPR